MRSGTESDEQETVSEMKRFAAMAPLPEVRLRVLQAAGNAWDAVNSGDDAVPWQAALAPVAASVCAVFLLILGSGHTARRSLAPWQASTRDGALISLRGASSEEGLDDYRFPIRPAVRSPAMDRGPAKAVAERRARLREFLGSGREEDAPASEGSVGGSESGSAQRGEAHASLTPCREGEAS